MKRGLFGRKGVYFFIIDVLVGVLVFFVTVAIISSFNSFTPSLGGTEETLTILTIDFFHTEVRDTDATNTVLNQLKVDGEIPDLTMSIDELIALLVQNGLTSNATTLLGSLTLWVPDQFGFNYTLDGQLLFEKQAIIPLSRSTVKLSSKKITVIEANLTDSFLPSISEVTMWQ